ncbi:hypothetical protein [Domibacillus aminovorans]|uniref:Uncharacterized protein n=1 Tax=Domibacillus aminovorans TaxID=29332 RepID=A0A177L9Y8_9BACI|nr:hypothetical protein [Domibacillus aminovorans]OAH61995.1 hypothetical protein AWH49_10825 [Domibacillus aminovorans]
MFEIKTFLQVHGFNPTDEDFLKNYRPQHISLDDSSQVKEYFDHRKFTPEYINMLITIKYKNKIVIGIDCSSGLDLWEQTYMPAVECYLDEQKVAIMYGSDPITMKIDSLDNMLLNFLIIDDWEPRETRVKAILPQKEFLEVLLDGAEQFWKVLLDYKVFEEKAMRGSTPRDYSVQMIEKVKELRERVKLLN